MLTYEASLISVSEDRAAQELHHGKKIPVPSDCGGPFRILCFFLLLPRDFEEPWRIIWLNTYMKTIVHLVSLEFYEFTCAYATIWSGGVTFPWFWPFGAFIDLLVDRFTHFLKANAASFVSFLFKTLLPCLFDFQFLYQNHVKKY